MKKLDGSNGRWLEITMAEKKANAWPTVRLMLWLGGLWLVACLIAAVLDSSNQISLFTIVVGVLAFVVATLIICLPTLLKSRRWEWTEQAIQEQRSMAYAEKRYEKVLRFLFTNTISRYLLAGLAFWSAFAVIPANASKWQDWGASILLALLGIFLSREIVIIGIMCVIVAVLWNAAISLPVSGAIIVGAMIIAIALSSNKR